MPTKLTAPSMLWTLTTVILLEMWVWATLQKNQTALSIKTKVFYGFGALASGANACGNITLANIQYISSGSGKCRDSSKNSVNASSKSDCEATTGNKWTADAATAGAAATTCTLGTNSFKLGAYTDVSSVNTLIQASDTGTIIERKDETDCN